MERSVKYDGGWGWAGLGFVSALAASSIVPFGGPAALLAGWLMTDEDEDRTKIAGKTRTTPAYSFWNGMFYSGLFVTAASLLAAGVLAAGAAAGAAALADARGDVGRVALFEQRHTMPIRV